MVDAVSETDVEVIAGRSVDDDIDTTELVMVSTVAVVLSCAITVLRGENKAATQMAMSVLRENILKAMIDLFFFCRKEKKNRKMQTEHCLW